MMIGKVAIPGAIVMPILDKRETLHGNQLIIEIIILIIIVAADPGEMEMDKVQQVGDLI